MRIDSRRVIGRTRRNGIGAYSSNKTSHENAPRVTDRSGKPEARWECESAGVGADSRT